MQTPHPFRDDVLHAGIWTLDRDGVSTAANNRMHEMLGIEPPGLVGTPLLEFVAPADHHLILDGLRRRAEGQRDSYDVHMRSADGRLIGVRIHASPVLDDDGTMVGSTAVVVDITDLNQAASEREAALVSAEESATMASSLLALASHELRTPLNTISGFAQLLELGVTDPHHRAMANKIVTAAAFINELCGDFISFARLNAGEQQPRVSTTFVKPLAESAVAIASSAIEARNCTVTVAGDDNLTAQADPERVVQILVNLLTNAAKHGGDHQHIRLELSVDPGGPIRCAVTDEGPGIPSHQHERVFMPFERLGNSTVEGTGLGLSIARALANAMGGSLTVQSEVGTGSTFSLLLPPTVGVPVEQHGLIVYVEDEELNASLVESIVAMLPGRRVHIAGTVAAGIEAVRSMHPVLVLLDLHLPDGSGLDVLTAIRADPSLDNLPVFMLTADATEESARAATSLGANRYITKPFELRSFLDLIEMATSASVHR